MARSSVLGSATRVEPRASDQESVAALSRIRADATWLLVRQGEGEELDEEFRVPRMLVEVLMASAEELAEGHAVTVLASEVLLTPAEAGELLGLSRPFVVRLMDSGQLPAQHLPGSTHRVAKLADVLEFQTRRERRRVGRRQVADAVDAADLPY
jgi:excisionase family DNA binding protein